MANILSIGQSALSAAQVGISTTGHNIANASTPGYSRQVVVQGAGISHLTSAGFMGSGTEVTAVQRVYSEYLGNQVTTSQSSQNSLGSYYSQIQQINNMLADSTVGVSPALQEFFSGVQNLASNPASAPVRQSLLSTAGTLATQFQGMASQLNGLNEGVNTQVKSSIGTINTYSQQIASLNNAIAKAQGGSDGISANDLLDQRDQLISELSKEIKVTVVKQGDDHNVFIGNGQPLVVGATTFTLVPLQSATDLGRTTIGYQSNGATIALAESALQGGKLGGLLEFRATTLATAQNAIGRMAIGLADTFNAQHRLGQDQNGALGGNFFNAGAPEVNPSTKNTGNLVLTAAISDVDALTTSDYQVQYVAPGNFRVTRVSDGAITTSGSLPLTIDGVDFNMGSGTPAAGDIFLVKPTAAGAAGFSLALTDTAKIAAAVPMRTGAVSTNTGSGRVSPGQVDASFTAASVAPAMTLTYGASPSQLTGFPAVPVTLTSNGISTVYAAGDPVPYADGGSISFSGVSFTLSGSPNNGDTFTIGPNASGVGDNRNALLLSALQTANTLGGSTASYQGAYAQLVNTVGNKTRELEANSAAAANLVASATRAQQSSSGVNLDEEAANLLRYQQAYQAAGKVMQTASTLFDVLLSLGN